MLIDVIVKLTSTVDSVRRSLNACVAEAGVSLAPLHPATTDLDLASYFVTSVEDSALDDVIARLRRCPGVEGAYAKPVGQPPGRM